MLFQSFISNRTKNFWVFQETTNLNFFALSIISIFIPILMLKLGFSLFEVILFNLVLHFFDVIFNFVARKILFKFGLKSDFIIGTFFIILFFIGYSFLDDFKNIYFLLLLGFFWAIYDSFYYVGFYYALIANTKKIENINENNILSNIFSTIVSFLGPLLGSGIILYFKNKLILVYVVIGFLFLSLIPLLKYNVLEKNSKNIKIRFKRNFRNIKNFLIWSSLSIFRFLEYTIFPIYIYFHFSNINSVAWLGIISAFSSITAIYFSGIIEGENREKSIMIGAGFLALIWFVRIFYPFDYILYLTSLVGPILLTFIYIPLDNSIQEQAKIEKNELNIGFLKNLTSMFAKFLFILIWLLSFKYLKLEEYFYFGIGLGILIILVNWFYLNYKNKMK